MENILCLYEHLFQETLIETQTKEGDGSGGGAFIGRIRRYLWNIKEKIQTRKETSLGVKAPQEDGG